MAVTHELVSAIADDAVAGEVGPDEWNAGHKGTVADFVITNETPSGTINGSNATFTLAATPVSGSVMLYRNGMRQLESTHFTISGATITMLATHIPDTGDWLLADYLATVT